MSRMGISTSASVMVVSLWPHFIPGHAAQEGGGGRERLLRAEGGGGGEGSTSGQRTIGSASAVPSGGQRGEPKARGPAGWQGTVGRGRGRGEESRGSEISNLAFLGDAIWTVRRAGASAMRRQGGREIGKCGRV